MKNIAKLLFLIGCLSIGAFAQTTSTTTQTNTMQTTKTKKPMTKTAKKSSDTKTTSDAKMSKTSSTKTDSAKTYMKGPKGGCYYMNGTKKVYVAKAKCQQ